MLYICNSSSSWNSQQSKPGISTASELVNRNAFLLISSVNHPELIFSPGPSTALTFGKIPPILWSRCGNLRLQQCRFYMFRGVKLPRDQPKWAFLFQETIRIGQLSRCDNVLCLWSFILHYSSCLQFEATRSEGDLSRYAHRYSPISAQVSPA